MFQYSINFLRKTRTPHTVVYSFFIFLLVAIFSTFMNGQANAAGPNVLSNPGCESGTNYFTGYQASLSKNTSIKRSGTASCKVTSTGGTYYIIESSQSIANPQKGQAYLATAWVRSDSNAGRKAYLSLRERGGSTAARTVYGPAVTLTTQWQQVSNTYIIQSTGRTALDFQVIQNPGSRTHVFYVDDMSFQLNTVATPTMIPTSVPTATPTALPTTAPTTAPTIVPTATTIPTPTPTVPTITPTAIPTVSPTPQPNKTCIPTVTSDTSLAPDTENWVQTSVIPVIKTWYPVVGDAIAAPNYLPTCTIKVVIDPNFNGLAGADAGSGTITLNADYARNNPSDVGLFVHESTHIMQNYPGGTPGWVIEGIADWTREYIYKDRTPTVPGGMSYYTDGYGTSAYFLNWIKNTYDPNIIRKLNVAGHNGTYSEAIFQQSTGGKTLDQLWVQMTGQTRVIGAVKGISSKCLDIPGSNTTNGTLLQIYSCNGTGAQQWTVFGNTGNQVKYLKSLGKCMDIQYSGTAESTPVWLWDCNGGLAQQWVPQTNGTLRNPNSNKCLAAVNNTGADTTKLRISTCNASLPQQQWRLP